MSPPKEDRPRGLGRGLSALIGDEAVPTRGEAATQGRAHPAGRVPQARPVSAAQDISPKRHLADLAAIGEGEGRAARRSWCGRSGGDSYEIVAGERRWRAAQMAKLHDVPVVVRELADAEALEIAIIENVQRADLNAIEEAAAYQELIDRFGRTQEQVAQEVGKSRSHVANTIRLLQAARSGQGAGAGRQADGRPCPNLVRRGRSRGARRGKSDRGRAERAPGRTAFGQEAKARWKSRQGPQYRGPGSQYFQCLGLKVQIIHKGIKVGKCGFPIQSWSSWTRSPAA